MKIDLDIGGRSIPCELRGSSGSVEAELDGRPVQAHVHWLGPGRLSLLIDGCSFEVDVHPGSEPGELRVELPWRELQVGVNGSVRSRDLERSRQRHSGRVAAPMPGKVVAVLVEPGDEVREGQGVLVIEAMKMENELLAPCAGVVKAIHVKPGQVVEGNVDLVEIA